MIPKSIRPNRRLGQNFLINTDVMGRMVRRAGVTRSDVVLEIGPGPGTLTGILASKAARVEAVEIDLQFKPCLTEVQAQNPNVRVVWGDALKVPLPAFTKAVACLPFNVSLPLVFALLGHSFATAVLLVQDRQAQRIAARPGDAGYGRVSITVAARADVELLELVPRGDFMPAPDVDGAVIRLTSRPPRVPPAAAERFRDLLDLIFLHRDHTIDAALAACFGDQAARTVAAALPNGIRRKHVRRAELDDFVLLLELIDQAGIELRSVSNRTKRQSQRSTRARATPRSRPGGASRQRGDR